MFEGYSPQTVDFLWGIRMNNNREWFLEHKQDYVNHLYQPTKALGQEIMGLFLDKPGELVKVSRIYRDTRMHHPLPYKESLWICVRRDVEWWAENPCLYFEICPEGVSYGFLLYRPRPATMEAIRQRIAAKPKAFLKLLRDTEKATGIPVTAELYKRPKEAPSPELAPYFAWKRTISCIATEPVSEDMFGPALGQRVCDMLTKLMPLYDFFNQFTV
ncbi:MAG: DUF2461 domain-containing protein [Oscillospiraceae bacterium]|nr:DUF2461 domain-containing protein [Oscillospiraceae bacterium]